MHLKSITIHRYGLLLIRCRLLAVLGLPLGCSEVNIAPPDTTQGSPDTTQGMAVAWGENQVGQWDVPAPNAHFISVAASDLSSVGLK